MDNGSEYGPQFEAAITAGVVDVFGDDAFELEVVRGASNVETLDPRDEQEMQLPDGRTYFKSFPRAET